ncbi:MAG: DUF4249 domain-containing protein [Bacteroidales bacterium]|nr:DUF4249 domain-containing protein [Bacteroidales bacterium]
MIQWIRPIIVLSFFLLFVSCEKIIQLDLNQNESVLVVDAMVSNIPNHTEVRLSESKPLFSAEPYAKISHAKVRIIQADGTSVILDEQAPGIYKRDHFKGIENSEYQLQIDWDGQVISANSNMPKMVPIDSLELVFSDRNYRGKEELDYALKVHFTDDIEVQNFYRFDVFRNDTLLEGFSVSNDLYYNGLETYHFIRGYALKPLDKVSVLLSCIDEANYSYFLVLSESNSPFNIAPGNPISNIQGQAIGYFGAFAQDKKEIIIPAYSDPNP